MLRDYIDVYIPGTINGNQPINQDTINKVVSWAAKKLSKNFGGCTGYNTKELTAQGFYVSNKHGLIVESILIIRAYHDTDPAAAWGIGKNIAQVIKRYLNQESVTIGNNNDGIEFF